MKQLSGFVFNGTNKESQERQKKQLKALSEGRDLKLFIEKLTANRDIEEREELHRAVSFARTRNCSFAIASLRGFTNRRWLGLEFLAAVSKTGVDIEVADEPIINTKTVEVLSAQAMVSRDKNVAQIKASLQEIKAKLRDGKEHKSSKGRTLKRLGRPSIEDLNRDGVRGNIKKADEYASKMWPIIQPYFDRGETLEDIAARMNERGYKGRKGGQLYASTIKNILTRVGVKR